MPALSPAPAASTPSASEPATAKTAPAAPAEYGDPIYVGKELGYYNAVVTGWVNTRMERDKSLLTLSGGGIALLTSVATAVGVASVWQIVAIAVGFADFVVSAGAAVAAFAFNATYLESEVTRAPHVPAAAESTRRLRQADRIMIGAFVIGVIATALFGVLIASARFRTARGAAGSAQSAPSATAAPRQTPRGANTRDRRDSTLPPERSDVSGPLAAPPASGRRPDSAQARGERRAGAIRAPADPPRPKGAPAPTPSHRP